MLSFRALSGLFVLALALSMARAAAPLALPRATPESQGVSSSALLDLVNECGTRVNALHSLVIVRHGRVIAEGWWAPYAAEEPHQMFSLSKSFTSTAVGLAIADGKFTLDDPVLKFFPDEAPAAPSANLRAMRVRDLLTMSTGHHNEDIQDFPFNSTDSVVQKFLALPVAHKPGTLFVYNTPATYMLSAIVQKTTGQTVLDYLRPRLFEPLGIASPTWEASKQGISMGGFGLSVRTEDIAKFGLLYLQHGRWNGTQLVPAAWTETATSRWVSNGSNPNSDWEQGYGFQFWRCRYGAMRGDGAHGQFCVLLPEQDAVVAITAGTRDLQGVLNVLWAKLLPALQSRSPLAEDAAAQAALKEKLAALTLKLPAAAEGVAPPKAFAGRRYVFPENKLGLEAVAFSTDDPASVEVAVTIEGVAQRLKPVPGKWTRGVTTEVTAAALAVSASWTAPDTLTTDGVQYRTPNVTRIRFIFTDTEVTAEVLPNLGAPVPPLKGRRETS